MNNRKKKTTFLAMTALAFALQMLPGTMQQSSAPLHERSLLSVLTTGKAASVSSETRLIPGGETIGVKINIEGVMVLGFTEIETQSGERQCPARQSRLEEGDIIKKIDGTSIQNVEGMTQVLQSIGERQVVMEVDRNNNKMDVPVMPVLSAKDQTYKLGAWVRDGMAGIGTLTFVEPSTGRYGALGHAITDADTNQMVSVGNGSIVSAVVVGVSKGQRGVPGELRGSFPSENPIGNIAQNTEFGIYGKMENLPQQKQSMQIATRSEVQVGPAQILSNIDQSTVEAYEIEIQKVNQYANNNKGLVIRVTDPRLLEATGGIVQGMSGSPIVQNSKIVGAVTHVLINDPTRGYGVFIEFMLEKAEKQKES